MPNSPTCSPLNKSTKPAAKRKVSPSSAKGQPKVLGRADRPALDPAAAAQDTMLISPTLLAALIARSIAKGFEPIVAELRDIAQTTHAASDRLFGESLKAKAHEQWKAAQDQSAKEQAKEQAAAIFEEVWGFPAPKDAHTATEASNVQAKMAQWVADPAPETSTDRLQGLMDKLWAQGYRPSSLSPRSFHEFEFYMSGMPFTVR